MLEVLDQLQIIYERPPVIVGTSLPQIILVYIKMAGDIAVLVPELELIGEPGSGQRSTELEG